MIKKTLHFNTKNNIHSSKNPYENCILNLRESYKNIKKIYLKSAEINIAKDYIDNGLQKDDIILFIALQVGEKPPLSIRINGILSSDSIDTIIQVINEELYKVISGVQGFNNPSVIFNKNIDGFIIVNIKGFLSECTLLPSYLLEVLGFNDKIVSNYDIVKDENFLTFNELPKINSINNYLSIHFTNLTSSNNSANGEPITFKIPINVIVQNNKMNTYFYNEGTNYIQSIDIIDKHFIFTQLNINLYNDINKIIQPLTLLNWSFTIELEFE